MAKGDEIMDVILPNEDETVGVVLPKNTEGYESSPVDVSYLRQLVSLAEEMEWEEVWVGVKDGVNPVLLEYDESDNSHGALAIAPLVPEEDDDG